MVERHLGEDRAMSKMTNLDDIRRSALDRAEESKRLWQRVITMFAVAEGTCLIAYLLLAYFAFPASVLILVAAVLVYSTVFAGIMGLKLHIDNSTQRILQAIESLAQDRAETDEAPPGEGRDPHRSGDA
jgi:hypothetical protein